MSYNAKRSYWWPTISLPVFTGNLISELSTLLGYGIGIGFLYLYKKYKNLSKLKKRQDVLTKKHFETAKKLNDDLTFIKYMFRDF